MGAGHRASEFLGVGDGVWDKGKVEGQEDGEMKRDRGRRGQMTSQCYFPGPKSRHA